MGFEATPSKIDPLGYLNFLIHIDDILNFKTYMGASALMIIKLWTCSAQKVVEI